MKRLLQTTYRCRSKPFPSLLTPPSTPFSTQHDSKKVYSNAEVRLANVEVLGFDYDFTLVSYTHQVQKLVYEVARNYLIDHLRYPDELANANFDSTFCIRGLVFDQKNGNLLKLSSRQMITPGSVFKGRRRLPHSNVIQEYNHSLHIPEFHIRRYCKPLPDLFSLAQGCLIADVIQLAEHLQIPYDPYWLHEDVSKAINYAHGQGGMHQAIMNDVERYIHYNPNLVNYWQREASAGKKLFLLTNSPFDFVDAGMKYLCGTDWLELFDVSMFEASKPSFFRSKKKFRSLDAQKEFLKWGVVGEEEIEKGRALVGGSVSEMMRLTKWKGKETMYWGDHVFADLAEPSRQAGWLTGAIVRELTHEVKVLHSEEYLNLAKEGKIIENEIIKPHSNSQKDFELLEMQRNANFRNKSTMFNSNFGSVFSSRGQSSMFGWNVRRLSDLYTSRLDNLLEYKSDHRFFPKKLDTMPHAAGIYRRDIR